MTGREMDRYSGMEKGLNATGARETKEKKHEGLQRGEDPRKTSG